MPLYEYRCRSCDHQFEVQQSFSDDPLSDCPECAGELRKVFTPVGITFKGSGFYKNDSRSSGGGSPSTTSGDAASGDGGSSDGGSSSNGGSSNGSSTKPAETATTASGATSDA